MATNVIKQSVEQSFKGLFVGDAVAMPVHWYYDVPAIKRDFNGWISRYEKPKDQHPTCILQLSNTGGSGRQSEPCKNVIGDVILHDKLPAWTNKTSKNHYHQDMNAGDNTLNCHCALQAKRSLQEAGTNDDVDAIKRVLRDYVEFMITPGTHNDTYAESWHRAFFSDWVAGGKPRDEDGIYNFAVNRSKRLLRQTPDKQLEVIGSFVVPTAVILHNIHRPLDDLLEITEQFVRLTHPVVSVIEPIQLYAQLLHQVVRGQPLRDEAERALLEILGPTGKTRLKLFDERIKNAGDEKLSAFQAIGAELGIACYIQGAIANSLLICRHFHDDFEAGILTNVNIGGENCHRGSAVGAMLGAAYGASGRCIDSSDWWRNLSLAPRVDQLLSSL